MRSRSSQFAGNEGYEGDEGDEGNEGDEGLKGDDAYSVTTGTTLNFATCKSSATAATVSQMKDVHLDLAAHAIHAFCDEHWDGSIMEVYGYAEDAGFALAQAISHVQAECVSEGNAFGCASAEAAASAWAEATVVAHSAVIAGAFSTCEGWCDVSVSALSVASSTTFYELQEAQYFPRRHFPPKAGKKHQVTCVSNMANSSRRLIVCTPYPEKALLVITCPIGLLSNLGAFPDRLECA